MHTLFLILLSTAFISALNITVNTSEELQIALDTAAPGDFILLGPSTFSGEFVASQNGTEEFPITVLPIDDHSKIVGNDEDDSIGFTVSGSFWNLKYFPIINFDVGVFLVNGTGNVLDSLAIQNISCGILVESGGNILNSCAISQATAVGIFVTDQANNTILNGNAIQDAEPSIVIEEGTCCGELKFNTALGGVEMKGSNYTFEGNVIKGTLNVTGCLNTFAEEMDTNPVFTESCENPDLGGNTYNV